MKIFLDMDGVIADFNQEVAKSGVKNMHYHLHKPKEEWTEEEIRVDRLVVDLMMERGFFRHLPVMKDAHMLWLLAGDPYVLTARPKYRGGENERPDRGDEIAQEKQAWMYDNFFLADPSRFVCCLREEKVGYASNGMGDPNILVDDLPKNCEEWEKAGGLAILFRNMEQACKDLQKAIKVING